jgi:hypothetical protein
MARTVLTSPITINVDPGHLQEACDHVVNDYDCQKKMITLQLAETEYTDQIEVSTHPLSAHVFTIRGTPGNPGAVRWTPHAPGACLRVTDYAAVAADGIEFGFYVNGGTCVAAYQFGIIDVQNCFFASCQNGVHMRAVSHGSINITGPYRIDGNADFHVQCDHAQVNLGAQPVAMDNHQTMGAFISVSSGGYVGVGGNPYSGIGSGGGTYGKQYDVSSNGVLRLNGVTLPGNVAGTVSSGGQVV